MSRAHIGVVWIGLVSAALVPAGLVACIGSRDDLARQLQRALAAQARDSGRDPCTLLSAGESEPYVGELAAPPYRASGDAPDIHGDQCMYRGTDGREVAVRPSRRAGKARGRALGGVPNARAGALSGTGAIGMDTPAHRVTARGPAGPWDLAAWIPGRALSVSRGDEQVEIDVGGASGQESDALALARLIVPRFGHPLSYDGAAAVALAPRPRPHPVHACDLVPRPAVEAAVGPLARAPTSHSPEASCTYRVAGARGERAYRVGYSWEGGQRNYRMLERDTAARGDATAAPGRATTVGFPLDTALRSTCDHAVLLHGTRLIAVRGDVLVGVSLRPADSGRARALLNAICDRL